MRPASTFRRAITALAAAGLSAAAGCAGVRTLDSGRLPVHGTAPLSHTIYEGSDGEFHYFSVSKDLSSGTVRVPRDDAVIEPAEFAHGSGRGTFVRSVEPGRIRLLVLGADQ